MVTKSAFSASSATAAMSIILLEPIYWKKNWISKKEGWQLLLWQGCINFTNTYHACQFLIYLPDYLPT